MLSPSCHYKVYWNGGFGTNMRAKVITLWGLLWFANHLYVEQLWVFGDTKTLIDHMNSKSSLNLGMLSHWLERIYTLKSTFTFISFCSHVYREKNTEADRLSKRGLEGHFWSNEQ